MLQIFNSAKKALLKSNTASDKIATTATSGLKLPKALKSDVFQKTAKSTQDSATKVAAECKETSLDERVASIIKEHDEEMEEMRLDAKIMEETNKRHAKAMWEVLEKSAESDAKRIAKNLEFLKEFEERQANEANRLQKLRAKRQLEQVQKQSLTMEPTIKKEPVAPIKQNEPVKMSEPIAQSQSVKLSDKPSNQTLAKPKSDKPLRQAFAKPKKTPVLETTNNESNKVHSAYQPENRYSAVNTEFDDMIQGIIEKEKRKSNPLPKTPDTPITEADKTAIKSIMNDFLI